MAKKPPSATWMKTLPRSAVNPGCARTVSTKRVFFCYNEKQGTETVTVVEFIVSATLDDDQVDGYMAAMKETIAKEMGIDIERVNIQVTTSARALRALASERTFTVQVATPEDATVEELAAFTDTVTASVASPTFQATFQDELAKGNVVVVGDAFTVESAPVSKEELQAVPVPDGLSGGAIAGIVIGVIAFIGILVGVGCYCKKPKIGRAHV